MRLTARSPQPDEARGLLRLAQELAQQGDYTAALAAIERAMRSGADEYICYLHIAALERQRHRADAAILALQHAIELQPNRSDAREKMAELYLESGQVDAAIEQATHVLRRDPDNITIRPLLVAAHLEKGDWEAALRVLDELIARAPTEPIYHFHQAQVFQELGQWGLALIAYDRVVELGTDRELVERAQEAMAMLDRIQIEHVLTLVLEDPQFRRAILENLEEALVERQFALSRPGMTALRILLHQLQERAAMQAYAVPLNHIERLQQHLRERTVIMGILNVTPDSFYDGGRYNQLDAAVQRALQMVEEGADIIDIGGESTRPGSQPVSEEEELRRVLPVIEAVRQRVDVPISVDTTKSRVAERALQAGACMVNDISGLGFDPHMAETVARYGALCCIMHIQGTPQTMQQNPHYDDVVRDISRYFEQRLALAERAGIPRDRIWLDPGIGFGKTVQHNLEILRRLREFTVFGLPLLIGTSRKSFIGKILGDLPPEERLEGTAATIAIAIANGASAVRVHDVREMLRVARVTDAIVRRPLSD